MAFAAGNTFVSNSSEKSPPGARAYRALIQEAGFPLGVIKIVTGAGAVGAALASHRDIAKIAFKGSAPAGRAVLTAAAKSNMKHFSLELGGKPLSSIFNDADLDNAVSNNSDNFLGNSGQICFAASRVKAKFEAAANRMGDTSLPQTGLGPLADKKQFDHVTGFLPGTKADGTQILVGGKRKGNKGQFVLPTILLNPDLKSRVLTEDIFGPVIAVRTFKTEEEAIEIANNTTFGLGSTFYTTNITRALRIAGKIEAGAMGINSSFRTSVQTPFGGVKQSGIGQEGGREGIKHYLQTKAIHINMTMPSTI